MPKPGRVKTPNRSDELRFTRFSEIGRVDSALPTFDG